jgi:hypothetical protein
MKKVSVFPSDGFSVESPGGAHGFVHQIVGNRIIGELLLYRVKA